MSWVRKDWSGAAKLNTKKKTNEINEKANRGA